MKSIKIVIFATVSSLFISTFASASETTQKSFSDVDVNTDYQKSILWMANNGVINGNPDGTFQPDKCVNRAELLKMLYKMLEVDLSQYNDTELFKDTADGEWYSDYIKAARARKTVQGYGDGTFKPAQCVKRVEAIKMAVLEFNYGEIPKYESNYGDLRDTDETQWYHPYLHYALSANLLGRNHTKQVDATGFNYYPSENMSRKEVAEMLYSMKTTSDNSLNAYDETYSPDPIVLKDAQVNYKTDMVVLTTDYKLEFDLYIERPDLGLQEDYEDKGEISGLSVDLNTALQPKLMYLSDINDHGKDTGSMCDRPRFPHRCEYTLSESDKDKTQFKFLLKTTFEDGTFAEKEITINSPKGIEKPEILFPAGATGQGEPLDITFKDVGATAYEIGVELCMPYAGDGINPCLDGTDYRITKTEDNAWIFEYGNEASSSNILSKDGTIQLTDSLSELFYEESVAYSVTAISKGKIDGIDYLVYNSAIKSFEN